MLSPPLGPSTQTWGGVVSVPPLGVRWPWMSAKLTLITLPTLLAERPGKVGVLLKFAVSRIST
jgi:hypothetical protein